MDYELIVYSLSFIVFSSPYLPLSPSPQLYFSNSLDFYQAKESIGFHQKDKDEDDIRNNFPQ